MKIATWNIERPNKETKNNKAIVDRLKKINADILILTETNEIINFANTYNCHHSAKLDANYYKAGEKRVSIYSKYSSLGHFKTFREDTSICINLKTPMGDLAVYGTVIGVYGNRNKSFLADLNQQLADFSRIAETNNLCISGDFNISFADNYYFTKEGRHKLTACFEKLKLMNLTATILQNIDHIILPKSFVSEKHITLETWNDDKKLSDHIGVAIEIK